MMSLKDKLFKKNVDERQEMDLLKVEHFGFWLMYYMLLAAIFIQLFLFEDGARMAAAEWIIFMSISVICLIGWIRKGVWNYHTRKVPGLRSLFLCSIFVSIGVGIFFSLFFSFKWNDVGLKEIALRTVTMTLTLFAITFPTLLIVGALAKRQEKKLADEDFDEEEQEEN